jgi:hypothetical protein
MPAPNNRVSVRRLLKSSIAVAFRCVRYQMLFGPELKLLSGRVKSLIEQTLLAERVICLVSSMSCHAGQRRRAGELLQDKGVRADIRRTATPNPEPACTDVHRQSALLRRNAHTVLLQP